MSKGTPQVEDDLFVARGAVVSGDVKIGKHVGIWYNAVVRGDEASIEIGDDSNVQDNAVAMAILLPAGISTEKSFMIILSGS